MAGLRGVHVFGWTLNQPSAVASDGTHVWVANAGAGSVVEFNASNGRFLRLMSGPSYQFSNPSAICLDQRHVWVANAVGSVTELNATTRRPCQSDTWSEPWLRTAGGDRLRRHSRLGD